MIETRLDRLFNEGRKVEPMSVRDLADWFGRDQAPLLRLPAIQRSLVWRNEQILNYWDSLLRGYPAGMMMVHRTLPSPAGRESVARDIDNLTKPVSAGGFQLFDGQQRLSAILLGLGKGPLSRSLKLWVDLGQRKAAGGRLFELRVNSEGQPFGYDPEKPNERLPLEERRCAHEAWIKRQGQPASVTATTSPSNVFAAFIHADVAELARARCAVPLAAAVAAALRDDAGLAELSSQPKADRAVVSELVDSVRRALGTEVILQLIDDRILDEDEYVRFFARLGQGGTRLTDDELTYSIIKNRYPQIHDRMEAIVSNTGRLASEVELVVGALRVAKALDPWPGAYDWQRWNRPTPKLIEELRNKQPTEKLFLRLVPAEADDSALSGFLEGLKEALLLSKVHPIGLPKMLLARMPRDLLEVLLLLAVKRGETPWQNADRDILTAFVLHWLAFVSDGGKAAYECYCVVTEAGWTFGADAIAHLILRLECGKIARPAPRPQQWATLNKQVLAGDRMASWGERFTAAERGDGPDPALALQVLSTNSELIRRVLLWLQRGYIVSSSPHYDATSTRDDDLPFDLDHAIPKARFGERWDSLSLQADLSKDQSDRFRDNRRMIGNSLGNYRWLLSSDNRRRGMDRLEVFSEALPIQDDIDHDVWNKLIDLEPAWSQENLVTFQRLIDQRTLRLSRRYVEESGISDLLDLVDHAVETT